MTAEPPECGRCGQAGILSARVPHHLVNARNETVRGTGIVVLCPRCDIGQPEAVRGEVTSENMEQAAELLHPWASVARVPTLDGAALEAEIQAWHGEKVQVAPPAG
ncbi:DUF6300 family protein [Microbispora bryophytorum]|uniref:DUF6300 family protein n=1 Tax=Microbispora bryophytorum TaxID=1460882 RepID=UPI003685B0C8